MIDFTESKIIEDGYRLLVELMNDGAVIFDTKGVIIHINNKFIEMIGYSRDEIIGSQISKFFDHNSSYLFQQEIFENLNQKLEHEILVNKKDGSKCEASVLVSSINDTEGHFKVQIVVIMDVSKLKQLEKKLKEKEEELELKASRLEEINTALKILIENSNETKNNIEKRVLSNVNEMICPYINKLKKNGLNEKQKSFLDMLESNIKKITSSFSKKLLFEHSDLTHAEYQIAAFVKEGKSSKEIADILCISERTVDTHRRRIRQKLGIANDTKNLRSHLLSFE
jgi:PAS domain S-box-containing protein